MIHPSIHPSDIIKSHVPKLYMRANGGVGGTQQASEGVWVFPKLLILPVIWLLLLELGSHIDLHIFGYAPPRPQIKPRASMWNYAVCRIPCTLQPSRWVIVIGGVYLAFMSAKSTACIHRASGWCTVVKRIARGLKAFFYLCTRVEKLQSSIYRFENIELNREIIYLIFYKFLK